VKNLQLQSMLLALRGYDADESRAPGNQRGTASSSTTLPAEQGKPTKFKAMS
jgi:hypothetical protein